MLALPRGGVPVAFEVAQELDLPLDVLLVRKLGIPGHLELAMGAIAEDGILYINQGIVDSLEIPQVLIEKAITREREELDRRRELYRHNKSSPRLEGKTVIIVDDGLATGATMRAAVKALKQAHVKHLVVAVPVGASDTCADLQKEADEVVCLYSPEPFYSVGAWYKDFSQTSDQEVENLLMLAQSKNKQYQE